MDIELQKSYLELLDRIKAEARDMRETVCHGISRRWKNLGRELGMTEEQIEQIEHKHKHEDFAVCASKVLDCFESKTKPSEREAILDQALIAAKRKDLADKIKPLMVEAKEQK
ncbi:hypothetical protein B566_EDAN006218 [Ephemera danica]|nr:hypothetical protein B566_EDAN006218 [Ephemera danica]